MHKLYIIKIGGNIIDNADELRNFLSDFSRIKSLKILVHGGGKPATELAHKLGISQALVNGRRITDAKTLEITTMVYAGLINKQIVAALQAFGTNAMGLSGADGNALLTIKRKSAEIDYGFVGDIFQDSINITFLSNLFDQKITPVFSAITHDGKGQLLNTNADSIASALAVSLSKLYKTQLIYCFEKNGVLKNINDENSVIKTITLAEFKQFSSDKIISGGMFPKLENAFAAIQNGVDSVVIIHAGKILNTINNKGNAGTKLINC